MDYTHVGRLGLMVSPAVPRHDELRPHTSEEDSHTIMDTAVAYGINFFDTANVYGRHLGVGATEEIIGRWFAKGVGAANGRAGHEGVRQDGRLAQRVQAVEAVDIRQACEASLRRLQTDWIDLYQMHHIDRDAWWDEIWEAMDHLKRQGKILYVGSSNFAGWHIARANEIATWRRRWVSRPSSRSTT